MDSIPSKTIMFFFTALSQVVQHSILGIKFKSF